MSELHPVFPTVTGEFPSRQRAMPDELYEGLAVASHRILVATMAINSALELSAGWKDLHTEQPGIRDINFRHVLNPDQRVGIISSVATSSIFDIEHSVSAKLSVYHGLDELTVTEGEDGNEVIHDDATATLLVFGMLDEFGNVYDKDDKHNQLPGIERVSIELKRAADDDSYHRDRSPETFRDIYVNHRSRKLPRGNQDLITLMGHAANFLEQIITPQEALVD